MKKLLLFILLVCIERVNGQVCFSPATNIATGYIPASVCSADFNGDGKKDLAVVSISNYSVSILLGTGTGNFGAAVNFAIGGGRTSVISADFNGDGNLDLAVADNGATFVSVLLGTGTGSFGTCAYFSVAASAQPYSVISADFNGDMKADLAVADYANYTVAVLLGNGAGSFGLATNFAAGVGGGGAQSITSADFNGDAKPDLATANPAANSIFVLLNGLPVIISGTQTICSGNSTTLTASGVASYTWSANAGSATTATVSVSPSTTDTYTVIGDNGTCTSTETVTVNVNALPTVNAVTSNTLLCVGQSAVLTASGANTYTWNTGPTTNTISVNPTSNTAYTVAGTDANGCSNMAVLTQSVSTCVGINQVEGIGQVSIYPNPVTNTLFIQTTESIKTAKCVNNLGQIVDIKPENNAINVSALTEGMYFLNLTTQDGKTVIKKFIKQ